MTLLFEGTLTLDGGPPVPARLELVIDRAQLAALLDRPGESGDEIPQHWEWRGLPVDNAKKSGTAGGFEPIEIREHSGRRIRFEHMALISDPAKIWAALAERFPWAGFKVPTGTPELTAGDLARADEVDHPATFGEAISLLDSDWATIEPHLDELVTDAGRPVRGYQSRIAEHLGGTNDGHFRRVRVEPLVTRFKAWIAEEWVLTSSSAPDDEEAENEATNAETPDAARVA